MQQKPQLPNGITRRLLQDLKSLMIRRQDISVSAVNDPNNGAAGLTNTSMNSATGYYLHATVELNSYYLLNPAFGYSQERIVKYC